MSCNSVICLQSQLSKIKLPVGPFYFMITLDLAHLCNICLVWHTTKFQLENGENQKLPPQNSNENPKYLQIQTLQSSVKILKTSFDSGRRISFVHLAERGLFTDYIAISHSKYPVRLHKLRGHETSPKSDLTLYCCQIRRHLSTVFKNIYLMRAFAYLWKFIKPLDF